MLHLSQLSEGPGGTLNPSSFHRFACCVLSSYCSSLGCCYMQGCFFCPAVFACVLDVSSQLCVLRVVGSRMSLQLVPSDEC